MSKNTKKQLLPNLRFPEFKNKGDWKLFQLSELLFETKQRNRDLKYDHKSVLSVSGEHGCVNQIEFLGRSYAGVSVKDYHVVEKGDIVYTKSPLKKNPYGIIKENKGKPGIVSTLYAVYRVTHKAYPTYLDYYFSNDYFLNSYLQPIVRKGAKNDMKVNNFDVLRGNVVAPEIPEQQKIADCLSSLDELITVENQKLEALQLHKKGLMQQLFPAVGEKLPKLRFKEFKDSGEWDETELGHLGELVSGLTYSPEDVRDEGLLVLRSSNIKDSKIVLEDCVFVIPEIKGANLTKPNDILVCVRNGSKSLIGKNALIPDGMPLSTHGAFMTVFRASNPKFVFQLFQSDLFKTQVDADLGATINSINGSQLIKYKFTCPKPKEQKRIADFLSSVDELIQYQSIKVEMLKAHKKGLMQQLFPDVNATE